jgi:cell division protease FtsH
MFGDPTTGASDDIERCTEIARAMVTTYGMSDQLGPQRLGSQSGEVFVGKESGHEATYSDEVAGLIDAEVRGLVDHAHDRARFILTTHRATLDRLASSLIERETLDDAELAEVFGDIDKGAGIEAPHEVERSFGLGRRPRPPVDVTVAEAAEQTAARPVPTPSAESIWRRVRRWRDALSPRPTGT